MKSLKKVPNEFFSQELLNLSKNLLNKFLIIKNSNKIYISKIVEVEAYSHKEKASHSYLNKKTLRNSSMFLEQGRIYVYISYGIHHCFNIVAGPENQGDGILIRAVEPINYKGKTNGPGRLCKTLKINKFHDGLDLKKGDKFYLAYDKKMPLNDKFRVFKKTNDYNLIKRQTDAMVVIATTRINIDSAGEDKNLFWRFYLLDNNYVSKKISRKLL